MYEGGTEEPEQHSDEGDSNWIVSYADMMTLLMSFFALMFSFSKPDAASFDRVRQSVSGQFGGVIVMPFEKLNTSLKKIIEEKHLEDKVRITEVGNTISVIFQGSTLFEGGSTELSESSRATISDFIDILREQASQYPIIVEGHTDDSPISTDRFQSNWELSGNRASLILRMLEAKGFPHPNLQSRGFADTRPVAPNRDAQGNAIGENQKLNRRITITILKELPTN